MNNVTRELNKLRSVSPSKEAFERGHYFLMARLESFDTSNEKIQNENHLFGFLRGAKSTVRACADAYVSHIALSLAVVVMVFASVGAFSAYQSRNAVSGPQYVLKRALENAHVALSSSGRKTELRVEQLGERVQETKIIADKAIEDSRNGGDMIIEAIQKVRTQAVVVREDIANVSAEGSVDIDVEGIQERIISYQIALDGFEKGLPDDIKEKVKDEVTQLNRTLDELNKLVSVSDDASTSELETESAESPDGMSDGSSGESFVGSPDGEVSSEGELEGGGSESGDSTTSDALVGDGGFDGEQSGAEVTAESESGVSGETDATITEDVLPEDAETVDDGADSANGF